ncbi:MAG: hypothetical protein DRH11_10720, partial [Deltaproteobacteria bacterium]
PASGAGKRSHGDPFLLRAPALIALSEHALRAQPFHGMSSLGCEAMVLPGARWYNNCNFPLAASFSYGEGDAIFPLGPTSNATILAYNNLL